MSRSYHDFGPAAPSKTLSTYLTTRTNSLGIP